MARDYTKYSINDSILPLSKRALAFEIVKTYNNNHKPTYEKIKEIFPDEVQGSKGFIRKKSEEHDPKRFHEEALISSDNVQYLVSNQWGAKNISGLLKKGEDLGIQIKKFKKSNDIKNTILKTIKVNYYEEDGNFGKNKKTGGYKVVTKHDENGNLIESFHYDREGKLWEKNAYKYDSNNNLSEKIEYDNIGKIERKTKYDSYGNYYKEDDKVKFDSKGRLQQNELLYSSGELMCKKNYEYNKDGCIIKNYNKGGNLERYEKSDIENNILEIKIWKPEYSFSYDIKGMKLSIHELFEYEYDSLNNWIKQTCYRNKSIHYISERKIEYS